MLYQGEVFFLQKITIQQSLYKNLQAISGYSQGFCSEGDGVAVELVIDVQVEVGNGFDEVEDGNEVLVSEFAGGEQFSLGLL